MVAVVFGSSNDINIMNEAYNGQKITVVTAVLNSVKDIEKTMLSVLNQTYPNIEYIVIDGGSKDGTVDVIKKYADRLAYWVSEKDSCIAEGMNKGIIRATGEYINFINSGDYFHSDGIFAEIFSKSHTADMIYGSFIGNFSGRSVMCTAHASATEKAWQGMQLCHSALFAKTSVLKKYKLDTAYRVSPDVDFVSKCVASGCTFERVDAVVFKVGLQGNSADHWLAARWENWQIARKYFPGLRTDLFHGFNLVREVVFRTVKYITSLVGIYQLLRKLYRNKFKDKIPLLPKGTMPYVEK
jgi:glycosyltransferase involved in cell wall biosynthesis